MSSSMLSDRDIQDEAKKLIEKANSMISGSENGDIKKPSISKPPLIRRPSVVS